MSSKEITGRKVFWTMATAFGIIIAVNVTLAVKAVSTFPGLETRNSYVASQNFDADRAAQQSLGWKTAASIDGGTLRLQFTGADDHPVEPASLTATLGRATHVRDDQTPAFEYDGTAFVAPVDLAPGNWNLRLTAQAVDGTVFRQRIVLQVP